jgi:hypothetical protein
VVVAVLVAGFLALRGGGGGGSASGAGLGTVKGKVAENGAFIHHVEVPAGSVLLVKVIPEGQFDTVLGIAADFPTIEKYKNNFGFTDLGNGQVVINSDNSTLDGIDLSGLPQGRALFVDVNSGFGEGTADPAAIPAPSAVSLDIVVTALDGGSGDITLQLETRKFIGPATTPDQGFLYVSLMTTAYQNFLDGSAEISDTRDFTKESDFTDNSDFSDFSDSFSSLDSLPK